MSEQGKYEVYGKNGVFIVAEPSGDVIGAFYAVEGSPGWWRGHAFGRVRKVFLPAAEPLTVAERFMRRT